MTGKISFFYNFEISVFIFVWQFNLDHHIRVYCNPYQSINRIFSLQRVNLTLTHKIWLSQFPYCLGILRFECAKLIHCMYNILVLNLHVFSDWYLVYNSIPWYLVEIHSIKQRTLIKYLQKEKDIYVKFTTKL